MAKKNEMSLGEAIDAYLGENNLKEQSLVQRVIANWAQMMGSLVAEHTQSLFYKSGIFYVKVDHPVWKTELGMAKGKIRDMINKELGAQLVKEVKIL